MTLLTPVAVGLIALSIPVILMYILKLRRQPQVVSSTFLWRRAIDDVQANAPWQRLRISTLLILQLLALAALVLVQTRPAFSRTQQFGGDLILILDQSYGMQARDVHPSRFAAAQQEAKALAGQVPAGNVVTVVGMGLHPTLAIAQSADQGAIDSAIDHLVAGTSTPNFLESLSLAQSLARTGQATRAIVLTSRDSGISTLPIQTAFPVQLRRIGGRLRDLGISGIGASAGAHGTSALVRVQNFGQVRESTNLNLFVDGQLADVRPISLGPGAESTQFWSALPGSASILRAVLTTADDMTSDKQAWTLVSSTPTRRVLLVSKGDYFLSTALEVNPSVAITQEPPGRYDTKQATAYDMVVFDNFLPPDLPAAPALLFAPPAGSVGRLRFGGYAAAHAVVAASPSSASAAAISNNVETSDVTIGQLRTALLPGWLESVYTAGGRPLVAAGQSPSGEGLSVMSFSPQDTDWPLRVSFPVLIQNLVQFLVPSVGVNSTSITAGTPVVLAPEPGVKHITVRSPTGATTSVSAPFAPYTATTTPGVYTVGEAGRRFRTRFVVNLISSRSAPATGPATVTLGRNSSGGSRRSSVPSEFGWIAALLCLGLLGTEWWMAFRR